MLKKLRDNILARWKELLIIIPAGLFLFSMFYQYLVHGEKLFKLGAFYLHAGWYINQGAIPYSDIWLLKPPLILIVTSGLAFIAGGNMHLLYIFSIFSGSVAGVISVYLAGNIIFKITNDRLASLAGGLIMLTIPQFYSAPYWGIWPKYFVLVFGLSSIYLFIIDNSFKSGVFAAVSAGFWQFGIIFPLIVVFGSWNNRHKLGKVLIAMATTTLIVLTPFIISGEMVPVIVETIFAPLFADVRNSIMQRGIEFILVTGFALPVVLFSILGFYKTDYISDKNSSILTITAIFFSIQILFFDLESIIDVIPWLGIASIGGGIYLSNVNKRKDRLVLMIIFVIILNPVWLIVSPPPKPLLEDIRSNADNINQYGSDRHGIPPVKKLYWNKIEPSSCHYYLSVQERNWINKTDQIYIKENCGNMSTAVSILK
jgi:hypothetical protein